MMDRWHTYIVHNNFGGYGLPKASSNGQEVNPFKYGGKELSSDLSLSYYDFEARMQLPALGIFQRPDPKAREFPSINTYSYCGGDPANRVDKNGQEWEIEKTNIGDHTNVNMKITGALLNLSNETFDMEELCRSITEQLENVYTFTMDGLSVSMNVDIKVVQSLNDIIVSDHVFSVINQSEFDVGSLAKTKGYDILLGTVVANETISGDNQRTVAHEVGHSGGLHDVNKAENYLTIDDPSLNLMTQIYALSPNMDKNTASLLEANQVLRIVDNYYNGNLNYTKGLNQRAIRMQNWEKFNQR